MTYTYVQEVDPNASFAWGDYTPKVKGEGVCVTIQSVEAERVIAGEEEREINHIPTGKKFYIEGPDSDGWYDAVVAGFDDWDVLRLVLADANKCNPKAIELIHP